MKTQSQTEHHYGKPLLFFFSAVSIAVSADALQMEKGGIKWGREKDVEAVDSLKVRLTYAWN